MTESQSLLYLSDWAPLMEADQFCEVGARCDAATCSDSHPLDVGSGGTGVKWGPIRVAGRVRVSGFGASRCPFMRRSACSRTSTES